MHHVVLICIDIRSVKLAFILKLIKNAKKKKKNINVLYTS